jgi:hypothetical protein
MPGLDVSSPVPDSDHRSSDFKTKPHRLELTRGVVHQHTQNSFGPVQDAAINPSVGEPVAFRLAVNHAAVKAAAQASGLAAAHAGRRATQVYNFFPFSSSSI